jgi:hypothetical protein
MRKYHTAATNGYRRRKQIKQLIISCFGMILPHPGAGSEYSLARASLAARILLQTPVDQNSPVIGSASFYFCL